MRSGISPSLVLMPTAFGATAGGLLALTGMPVNVIVSDAASDAGVGSFAFFSFALVGVPLLAEDDRDLPGAGRPPPARPHRPHDRAQPLRARPHAGPRVRDPRPAAH